MKTIDRFVLKKYFGPMILTFFIVMFVLMMNFMWRYIDELVGKGLDVSVIAELMMWAAIQLVPMGLPLATLLAAIMTMGNLGENYELLAMKSSGMSLLRILRSIIIVIFFIAVGSFFVANNLVPHAMKKMTSLIWDIKNQKQTIEFKDGLFFNGIDNISIRVEHQDSDSGLLTGVLIYDTGNQAMMSTIVADSGYITISDDKRYLNVLLYNGQRFETTRSSNRWNTESVLNRNYFDEQLMVIKLDGFDFQRSDDDDNTFSNEHQSKNIRELEVGIDSLTNLVINSTAGSYGPYLNSFFAHDNTQYVDSLRGTGKYREQIYALDSLPALSDADKQKIFNGALQNARSSVGLFTGDEERYKDNLSKLYKYKIEWHRKMALPVSIMIFFLIGAPLGAIIRRGGLGMPIVISVIFFVIYYIISITGEKLAKEGSWSTFLGMWFSAFILLPIALFLLYKATNDSNLFNAEWYITKLKAVRDWFITRVRRVQMKAKR